MTMIGMVQHAGILGYSRSTESLAQVKTESAGNFVPKADITVSNVDNQPSLSALANSIAEKLHELEAVIERIQSAEINGSFTTAIEIAAGGNPENASGSLLPSPLFSPTGPTFEIAGYQHHDNNSITSQAAISRYRAVASFGGASLVGGSVDIIDIPQVGDTQKTVLSDLQEEEKKKLQNAQDLVTVSNVTRDIVNGVTYVARDEGNKSINFSIDQDSQDEFLAVDNGRLATDVNILSLLHSTKENSVDPGFVSTSYEVENAGSAESSFTAHRGPFLVKESSTESANSGYQINAKGLGGIYV